MMSLGGLQTTDTVRVNKSSYAAENKKDQKAEDSDECEMDFGGKLLFAGMEKKRTLEEFNNQ